MKKPFETRTPKDCQATAKLAAYPYSLLPENEAEEGTENKEKGEEGQMEERERGMRRDKGGGKKEGGEQKGKSEMCMQKTKKQWYIHAKMAELLLQLQYQASKLIQ